MTPFNNPQLKLAFEFVQNTGRNVFLTGKAGTGKTTFLHNLKKETSKRIIVVAPTGVAAINAGGVTIHSFFQLLFGPQLPNSNSYEQGKNSSIRRFSKEKINIIRSIDLLVIDEISMVRADLLDGIDSTLRRFKNRNLPFGGAQLLMIGDLQQLAPVVKENEWNLLRNHYTTSFFFGSLALQKTNYISIELLHVYRQSDESFINLLNKVRNNQIDHQVIETLNSRYNPNFISLGTSHIILTTHNAKAKQINDSRIDNLPHNSYSFSAKISGNFPEFSFPTEGELKLKKGAQVMFIKNDPNPEKQYFNGKIGAIIDIDDESITVQCDGDDEPISVEKLFWEKVVYRIDDSSKEIVESIEGTFVQYPLKLAWAITIHKSQGLTFENAVIDAQDAFTHGQVYVALSRCKTLEGLVLSSKIVPRSVMSDNTVDNFSRNMEENQPNEEQLKESKKQYQLDLLLNLFNFLSIQKLVYYAIKLFQEHQSSIINNPLSKFTEASKTISSDIVIVSNKFHNQLNSLFKNIADPENNEQLQKRITKASAYFSEKLKAALETTLNEFTLETDNKVAKKAIKNTIDNIHHEYQLKTGCLKATLSGFNLENYLKSKALASISESKSVKKKTFSRPATGEENPELYRILKAWRDAKAEELDWQVYRVIQLKTMREICKDLPSNPQLLSKITGVGKMKIELFSDEILDIINEYIDEYNIKKPEEVEETKENKKNTKKVSYDLFNEGMSIKDIANKRGLVESTVEQHLAHYIGTGDLNVKSLISDEKINMISSVVFQNKTKSVSEIKQQLTDKVSYSDIKFTILHLIFERKIDF